MRPAPTRSELARAELREETGLTRKPCCIWAICSNATVIRTRAFTSTSPRAFEQGEARREHSEQDMISRAFPVEEVLTMISDGAIKDAATVATLGLLRLRGFL